LIVGNRKNRLQNRSSMVRK